MAYSEQNLATETGLSLPTDPANNKINFIYASSFHQPPWAEQCGLDYLTGRKKELCSKPGLNVDMFLFMAQLLKFNYSVRVTPGMGAPNGEGKWGDSMIGDLHRNTVNMSVNTPYHTFARGKALNYMTANGQSKLAALILRPSPFIRVNTLILPYQTRAWILIAGAVLSIAFLCLGFIKFEKLLMRENSQDSSPKVDKREIRNAVESSLLPLISQGQGPTRTDSASFVLVSWHLVSLVLVALYNAVLFEFLSNAFQTSAPFSTVAGLAATINDGAYKVLMPTGIRQYLSNVLAQSRTEGMLALRDALRTHPPVLYPNGQRFNAPMKLEDFQIIIG